MENRRLKVGIAHPGLGRGGSEARALWSIEALRGDFDVSLITAGDVDVEQLNSFYGTSLQAGSFTVCKAPGSFLLNSIKGGDALRGAYYQRFCRNIAPQFDVLISAYNLCDFGVPAIQCIADFCWDDAVRLEFDPAPQGHRGLFHRSRILRKLYLGLADMIAKPSGRDLFAGQDVILANSKWTAELVRRKYNMEAEVLYPPVTGNFPEIPPQKKERGFVCIGRITPEKRIEKIVEVLKAVRLRGHDIHLHILGDTGGSPYGTYIMDICRRERDWISLEGLCFGEKKKELLSGHLFGIHGRQAEAFGIAVAEMVKAGCITFVPSEGGQVEIVDHPFLTYTSAGDAVDKIDAVLRQPALREELGSHLKRQGERFSTGRFMSGMRGAVTQLLATRAKE